MKNIALRIVFILSIYLFVGGLVYAGTPALANTLLVEAALLIFGIQVLVFLPSYWAQTEHFYDLTGGITYLSYHGVYGLSPSSDFWYMGRTFFGLDRIDWDMGDSFE